MCVYTKKNIEKKTKNKNMGEESERTKFVILNSFVNVEYAKAALNVSRKVIREQCEGCRVDHPSQRRHSCVMEEPEDLYLPYLEFMLDKIDHEAIRKRIDGEVAPLYGISGDIVDRYFSEKLPKGSDDDKWASWADKIVGSMERITKLENRF